VRILLERDDTNPNLPDAESEQIPLSFAAENGYEVILRLLLEREDTNPNTFDISSYQSPLAIAAEKGYEGMVKLLLERGANPNTQYAH